MSDYTNLNCYRKKRNLALKITCWNVMPVLKRFIACVLRWRSLKKNLDFFKCFTTKNEYCHENNQLIQANRSWTNRFKEFRNVIVIGGEFKDDVVSQIIKIEELKAE